MPASLTAKMDPNDPRGNVYGVHCPEHPDQDRHGLVQHHALNALAKHNREQHREVYQVGAMAALVRAAAEDLNLARQDDDPDKRWTHGAAERHLDTVLAAWMTLLGLPLNQRESALERAYAMDAETVAHVAPF